MCIECYVILSFIWLHFTCFAGFHPDPPTGSFLKDYDILNYSKSVLSVSRKRVRRSQLSHLDCEHRLPLSAFDQRLTLCLYFDGTVVHKTSKLTIGGREWPGGLLSAASHMVRGHVQDHPKSMVYGSILGGIFRGTISLDKTSVGSSKYSTGAYYVEPAGYFFNYETPFHSVIYHDKHINFPQVSKRLRRSVFVENKPVNFCGLSDPSIARRMSELSRTPSWLVAQPIIARSRRASVSGSVTPDESSAPLHMNLFHNPPSASVPVSDYFQFSRLHAGSTNYSHHKFGAAANTRVCNLYLQSDTYLWDRVISLQHINGDRELAVKEITSIFMQHVQGAQAIYQYTLFKDHSGNLEFHGISFRVDHVRINITEEDCKPRTNHPTSPQQPVPLSPTALPHDGSSSGHLFDGTNLTASAGSYADENPFCVPNIDVTNYLNLHSYNQHDDFCLAYVFTYRDFSSGTLGLAWVAEPSGSGGVCERHRLMREGSHTVNKNLNTGVVTLLNYGSQVALKVSQLTFSHEMGHNFGAKHDDDHKDEPFGCLPSFEDPRGNYIMFASATSGDKENNNKFSTCSTDAIARLLDRVISSDNNCFLSSDGPFCGNQLTEDGEQCDCGFTSTHCRDQCCHPKESPTPCQLTDRVWFNRTLMKVQCSPTAGECCTQNCQYRSGSHLCRPSGECHRPAYCSGVDSKCPPSENLPNGTPCQDQTRVCKGGQCLGSICERIPGWHECSLTRDKQQVTPEMMCYVACRKNLTRSPCISTFQLQQDADLQKRYPQLTAELLHSGRGTQLKPGAPCDNYRGYCDVFLRCQSVEAEGPLARLRNLIFSPQMLQRIKTWITVRWWAVILICVGTIIGMIVFVKLCAASTPGVRYPLSTGDHRQRIPVAAACGGPILWTTASSAFQASPPPYPRDVSQHHSTFVWSRKRRNRPRSGHSSRRKQRKTLDPLLPMPPPTIVPTAPPLQSDCPDLSSSPARRAPPLSRQVRTSAETANRSDSQANMPSNSEGPRNENLQTSSSPDGVYTVDGGQERRTRNPHLKSKLQRSSSPHNSESQSGNCPIPTGTRVKAVVPSRSGNRSRGDRDRIRLSPDHQEEGISLVPLPLRDNRPESTCAANTVVHKNTPPPAYEDL